MYTTILTTTFTTFSLRFLLQLSAPSNSYSIVGLQPNEDYIFRFRAFNTAGSGPWMQVRAKTIIITPEPAVNDQPARPTRNGPQAQAKSGLHPSSGASTNYSSCSSLWLTVTIVLTTRMVWGDSSR